VSSFPPEIISAAQTAQAAYGVPASVTLAQWALESDYGQHMPQGSNNPFGIKAKPGQDSVMARPSEYVGGRWRRTQSARCNASGHFSGGRSRTTWYPPRAGWG